MPLINLTEEYIKSFNPPFYERIRIAFELDLYWASSLSSIEDHFRQSPPTKKDRWFSAPSAYIALRNLKIKRMFHDSFDEEDGVSLAGLNDGLCFPFFEIKDETTKRLSCWMAGNSSEYQKAQEEFGFNRDAYVTVPKVYLKYLHYDDGSSLIIKSLDQCGRHEPERKSLKEKILELIPKLPSLIPQPVIIES